MVPEIAIIDDDPEILRLVDTFIKRTKRYRATCFTDAVSGLDYIEKNNIKIVLVDIQMREMFGNDVVKRLVELHQGINIIVITASNNYLNFKECYTLGARDFLLKPFTQSNLIKTLDYLQENVDKWRDQLELRMENKKRVV